MATDSFTIDFKVVDELIEHRIVEFQRRVRDGAHTVASDNRRFTQKTLPDAIRQNFKSGGRPKWAPRKENNPWPLLVKHGEMFASAIRPVNMSSFVYQHKVMWIADVGIVGAVHQYGWRGTQKVERRSKLSRKGANRKFERNMNIPARPFFSLPPGGSVEREFLRQWIEYAVEPFTKKDLFVTGRPRMRSSYETYKDFIPSNAKLKSDRQRIETEYKLHERRLGPAMRGMKW